MKSEVDAIGSSVILFEAQALQMSLFEVLVAIAAHNRWTEWSRHVLQTSGMSLFIIHWELHEHSLPGISLESSDGEYTDS